MVLNIQLKVGNFKIIMQSVIKGKTLISKTVSPITKFQFIMAKQNSMNLTGSFIPTKEEERWEGGGRIAIKDFYQKSRNRKMQDDFILRGASRRRGKPWNVCIFYSSRFKRHFGEYFRMN